MQSHTVQWERNRKHTHQTEYLGEFMWQWNEQHKQHTKSHPRTQTHTHKHLRCETEPSNMDRKNCMVQCKIVLCHLKVNESLNGLILNPPMNHTADTFGMARRHAQKKDERNIVQMKRYALIVSFSFFETSHVYDRNTSLGSWNEIEWWKKPWRCFWGQNHVALARCV